MTITAIPPNDETSTGLGQVKADARAYTNPISQIGKVIWNNLVAGLILLFTELGLTSGATAGSVNADLVNAGIRSVTFKTQAPISTADATPTTALTLTLPNGSYRVYVKVISKKGVLQTLGTGSGYFTCSVNAGVAGANAGYGVVSDLAGGQTFAVVASGGNLLVQVTGIVATNITWTVVAQVEVTY